MIINLILILLIGITCYLVLDILISKNINEQIKKFLQYKNEKYYDELIKQYEKNKKIKLTTKLNIIHKINILFEKAGLKRGVLLNPFTIIVSSILSFFICYLLVFHSFKIILLSLIISLPATLIPIIILSFLAESKSKKIEKVMLNFLLQLKNYTKINNDIIYAFKQVKTVEPLQSHIKKFLVEMNSGIRFEKAIENLKEKINFEKFNMFLTNLQYCYANGGSFSNLISKSYKMISEIQNEKNTREQETMGARIVLVILILLDLFVYFTFIKNNHENYLIMTKSIVGNLILYWNFISIWILIGLIHKVKKLDY